ncbi:MAG TPA: hypothetical protein VLS46_04775 [Gaiellaceae bacterium]|nr:hypothetical protein [Gaiellaceae bacterium]
MKHALEFFDDSELAQFEDLLFDGDGDQEIFVNEDDTLVEAEEDAKEALLEAADNRRVQWKGAEPPPGRPLNFD